MVSGTQEEQEVAKEALETAQMNEAAAAQNVESMQTITDNAKRRLQIRLPPSNPLWKEWWVDCNKSHREA